MLISVVSPVYGAAGLLPELVARLVAALEPLTSRFEIVLVDDRSPDDAWTRICEQAAAEPRVRGLRLSRNFGQHRAITAGLAYCEGEWVVVLDCDLQDRPEEIPALLARAWGPAGATGEPAFDVVFARRAVRQDSWLKTGGSRLFYGLLSYLTDTRQDPAVANFGVFRRRVVQAVLAMPESIRYFPAMVRWVGFRATTLDVAHAGRSGGRSSYTFGRRVQLALDTLLAYSDKPMRLTVVFGLGVAAATFGLMLVYLVKFLRGDIRVLGYTSLILSVWFFSGLLLAVLGMVGLYVGKTFEQAKNRPHYVLDETVPAGPGASDRAGP